MPNITIHLDDETHRLAKIFAAQSGLSLSKSFRDHVRSMSSGDVARITVETMERAALQRYARGELTANETAAALNFTCLEELFGATVRAGLHLPHLSKTAALRLAKPLTARTAQPKTKRAPAHA